MSGERREVPDLLAKLQASLTAAKATPTPVPSGVAETTAGERCTTTSATYEDADGTVRCWACSGIAHETTAGERTCQDGCRELGRPVPCRPECTPAEPDAGEGL